VSWAPGPPPAKSGPVAQHRAELSVTKKSKRKTREFYSETVHITVEILHFGIAVPYTYHIKCTMVRKQKNSLFSYHSTTTQLRITSSPSFTNKVFPIIDQIQSPHHIKTTRVNSSQSYRPGSSEMLNSLGSQSTSYSISARTKATAKTS